MVVLTPLYDVWRPYLSHFQGPTIKQSAVFCSKRYPLAFLASHNHSKKKDRQTPAIIALELAPKPYDNLTRNGSKLATKCQYGSSTYLVSPKRGPLGSLSACTHS